MISQDLPSVGIDAVIAAACVCLVALIALLFVLCRKNKEQLDTVDSMDIEESSTGILHAQSHPLSDISTFTDGFHPKLIVGKGRLGTVYMAATMSGYVLAMKRIHPHLVLSNAAGLRFSSKIKSLSFASHPNVVSILGYSEAPGERIIITEFIGMGSLESCLCRSKPLLDWRARLRIAAGAARGIEHLHEGLGIVHGRVKASNIMIDDCFCSRVCDYGLSFLSLGDRRGLEGYTDGEGREEVSKANDVYGFGVLLLEILSGRSEGGLIGEWGLPLIRGGRVEEVLDQRIGLPEDMRPLVRMAKVASACVGNGRKSRPTMSQVAAILSSLELEGKPCC